VTSGSSDGAADDRPEDEPEDDAEPTGRAPDESGREATPEAEPGDDRPGEDQPGDDEPGEDQPGEDEAYDGYGRYEAFPLEEEYHTALPRKIEAWRQRSATGAILTGMALGFQKALGTERNEPAIVVQTSGDPPRDLPVEADFEFRRPRQSVVNIRPWLLESSDATAEEPDSGDQPPSDEGRSEPPKP